MSRTESIDKSNFQSDQYGIIHSNTQGVIDSLLCGVDINDLIIDDSTEVECFKQWLSKRDHEDITVEIYEPPNMTVQEFDERNQKSWNIPTEYAEMDITDVLFKEGQTPEQIARIEYELSIFEKYDMIDILKAMVYIVNLFRSKDIVYGVGRGSSVASYILYVIGIHRIDSLEYDIDFEEFLS